MELAAVERALDALEAAGARSFDAPACDCIRSLITRAEQLGGAAAPLLAIRAADHLARLEQRLSAARARAQHELELVESKRGPLPTAREALARGEVVRARRSLFKRISSPSRPIRVLAVPAQQRIVLEYDAAVAELVAAFALARADDVVPEDAGPYNPLRIASELLSRMRTVSPLYLTTQLNRLEELASLLELPELPGDGAKALPTRKRKALKKGS